MNRRFIQGALVTLVMLLVASHADAQIFRRDPAPRSGVSRRSGNACLDCHRDKAREFTSATNVHRPVSQEKCEVCHRRHGIAPRLMLIAEGDTLCINCHAGYDAPSKARHPSIPGVKGACLACHAPHVSENPALLRNTEQQACAPCHDKIHAHPRGGRCAQCHAMHSGTPGRGALKEPLETLCGSCHRDVGTLKAHGSFNLSRVACNLCHASHGDSGPVASSERSVHAPVLDGGCRNCHTAEPRRGAPNLSAPPAQLCRTCHSDLLPDSRAAGAHPPAEEGACLTCHLPHTSPRPHLLKDNVGTLCGSCHQEMTGHKTGEHAVFARGECATCHNPHGATRQGALRKDIPALCGGCHASEVENAGAPGAHPPQSECATCHEPHRSPQPLLLKEKPLDLCGSCHADQAPTARSASVHAPLADTGCIACHELHADRGPGRLRDLSRDTQAVKNICGACHQLAERGRMHSPVKEGECLACHVPHVSDQAHLLARPAGALCVSCHEDIAAQSRKPNGHPPVMQGRCIACHEPHGADEGNLLRRAPEKLCISCHEDLVTRIDSADSKGLTAHPPAAERNCEICHDVHGSGRASLLTEKTELLCGQCHSFTEEVFVGAHRGIAVARTNCAQCHDPHVGGPKLLLPSQHSPFASRECSFCHDGPGMTLTRKPPELCYICHGDRVQEFALGKVHAPVEAGECLVCHSPHASRAGKLLLSRNVCATCHDDIAGPNGPGDTLVHRPVRDGNCAACHQPHNSTAPGPLLRKAGGALCITCHAELSPENAGDQTMHAPVAALECGTCHSPHRSGTPRLLLEPAPGLCLNCHSDEDGGFKRAHQGMSGSALNCLSCHSPHLGRPKLVSPNLHAPVARGLCGTCHAVESNNPTGLRKPVRELCRTCHIPISRVADGARVPHPPAADGNCIACHDPHGSAESRLLKGPQKTVCGQCHARIVRIAETAKHPHPATEKCSSCHAPHGNNNSRLIDAENSIKLCAKCHETQGTFAHPVGPNVRSPVDGSEVTCLNCHAPHGSSFQAIFPNEQHQVCGSCHMRG